MAVFTCTVTSSASYVLDFGRLEVQKCGGFVELASACVLYLPSITSRVFWTEVMNWVSRRFQNGWSILEWFRVLVWGWVRQRCRVRRVWRYTKAQNALEEIRVVSEQRLSQVSKVSWVWVWYSECGNIHDTGNLYTQGDWSQGCMKNEDNALKEHRRLCHRS